MPSAHRFAITLALALCVAASPSSAAEPADPLAQRGVELLAPFKADLQRALRAGLEQGPQSAVAACQLEAPAIAARLSDDQVRVGRSSHRLRNPDNAPAPWMREVLDVYLAEPSAAGPRVIALDQGRVGYAEPIRMQALCLVCHGSDIAPELAALIAERYPQDAATGFEAGELRGIFWAEYPASAHPSR